MYSPEIGKVLKSKNINIGNRIAVTKGKVAYEGILMPRIELGDLSSLVIKLDNGYNIGIKYEKGAKIKKINTEWKLPRPRSEKSYTEITFDKNLPTISVIGTGGTITSKVNYKTGGVITSFSAEDIARKVPELKDIANLRAEQIMSVMSEDIHPDLWIQIAHAVAKEINSGSKGVIITHGTDTLHYTSAALSFILNDLPVPVALVGAQRSSDRGSSDSIMNFSCAANFTANSDIAEVCTVMHGSISDDYCLAIRGTRVRKMDTERRDAFKPINDLPLAKIHWQSKKIEIVNPNYKKRSDKKVKIDSKLEKKVALIKVYPGLDPEIFDFYLTKNYKGIVIEATGLGHTPTLGHHSLLPKVEQLIKNGIPVAITSQCLYGRTHPTAYTNLRELSKRGTIFCEDMLPEVAYIKLMHVLPKAKNMEDVKRLMLTNLVGEISKRTEVVLPE